LGRYVSCVERTAQRKDADLILMVRIETRHPVEGPFGSQFWRSVIMRSYDGLKSQDLEML